MIGKIYYFQFQMAITPKRGNPELLFLHPADPLIIFNIWVMFREDSLNSFFKLQSRHN